MVNGFNHFISMSISIGIKFISFMCECFHSHLKKSPGQNTFQKGGCVFWKCVCSWYLYLNYNMLLIWFKRIEMDDWCVFKFIFWIQILNNLKLLWRLDFQCKRKINARVEMKKKADLFCLNSNTWDVATCTCYC